MADTDLRRLFLRLKRTNPEFETVFAMAFSRTFWTSTLPVYLSMYKDLRLHGPSTAALMEGTTNPADDAVDALQLLADEVHDLRQQE